MIFEYVLFDEEISYELTPGTAFNYNRCGPISFQTSLVPTPSRVKDMKVRFDQLWAAADPEGQIGGGSGVDGPWVWLVCGELLGRWCRWLLVPVTWHSGVSAKR